MLKDLQRAPEFDQSALFKKIYEEEYGVFGGAPFGALVGDYEFGKHPEDHGTARRDFECCRRGARAVRAAAAAPDLFNLPSWTSLDAPRDLAKIFDTTEYAKWKSFRQTRRLPLRGAVPAAHVWAGCPTAKTPSRSKTSTMKSTWTAAITPSICG